VAEGGTYLAIPDPDQQQLSEDGVFAYPSFPSTAENKLDHLEFGILTAGKVAILFNGMRGLLRFMSLHTAVVNP